MSASERVRKEVCFDKNSNREEKRDRHTFLLNMWNVYSFTMASRTREKVLHAKGNLRFWNEEFGELREGKCRATKQRRTNVLADFSSFTSFAIFSLNYGMLLHYTISIFQPLLCTYIFSLSLSLFSSRGLLDELSYQTTLGTILFAGWNPVNTFVVSSFDLSPFWYLVPFFPTPIYVTEGVR